jgi:hypothetical protein
MFNRHLLFVVILAAAAFGPAIYFSDSWKNLNTVENSGFANGSMAGIPVRGQTATNLSPNGLANTVTTVPATTPGYSNNLNPSLGFPASPPPAPLTHQMIVPGNAYGPDFGAIPLEFMPITNLAEIFRFDVNPDWVRQRWDRASYRKGESNLSGLRVPLVTGVNTNDLFGSLTYYFDSNRKLQKITFRGWSGNPAPLVGFLTSRYQFRQQPTSAAGLYVAGSRRKKTGVLLLQYPSVISASNPTQQIAILMEINNPDGSLQVSNEVAALTLSNTH